MARVMITGVGGPAGSSLANQLRTRGHYVLGVDMHIADLDAADDVIKVPAAEAPGYLQSLRYLAMFHGIDLVIPTVSDELPQVAAARESFGEGTRVLIADAVAVTKADDKYATMLQLQSAGVSVPQFGLPSDFTSAHEAFDAMGGPFIIKPRVSRGGRGVAIIDTPDEQEWDQSFNTHLIQQFAPGTEYAPVVHATYDPHLDFVVVLEKTELKEGRIGNAVSVRRVDNGDGADDVADLALRTAQAMQLTGPMDIDIRRLDDGTPVVLEVNARFGANSAYAPELLDSVLSVAVAVPS